MNNVGLKVYTAEEAAAVIRVNTQTLRRYLQGGELRARKVGREWRITEDAISEFLHGDAKTDTGAALSVMSEVCARDARLAKGAKPRAISIDDAIDVVRKARIAEIING